MSLQIAPDPRPLDSLPLSPIRILVINPNSTPSMTIACLKTIAPTLPSDVQVLGATPTAPSPTAIESAVDNVLSAAATFKALGDHLDATNEHYDAFLVACYSAHALIPMLREEFSQPVIGIMEASLFAARTLGGRFGIIATSARSKVMHQESVRGYGFEGSCAGIASCDLGVLDLERLPSEEVKGVMCARARDLVGMGAEVLTLGCAGMAEMRVAVQNAVERDGVRVVDGTVAGVQHLVGLVRMGLGTAKGGVYRSSKVQREKRGQRYVWGFVRDAEW